MSTEESIFNTNMCLLDEFYREEIISNTGKSQAQNVNFVVIL